LLLGSFKIKNNEYHLPMNENKIWVKAPARLHFGFVDLNGGTGRRFGSLGLTIKGLDTQIQASRSTIVETSGADAERARRYANRLLERLGLEGGISINIESAIPSHSGLGSGTQMALAVGKAIEKLFQIELGSRDIAAMLGRGNRSGIGIGAFEQGGFLVDGGRRSGGPLPSILFRTEFPDHWRVLLIFDAKSTGLHGDDERLAFQTLPTFPDEAAGALCRLLVMKVLPGLVEQQLDEFGESISEIQRVVGDYFSPAQGARYSSPAVAKALGWLGNQGIKAVGQSSWGPTGFAIIDGETQAVTLMRQLKAAFPDLPLQYQVVAGQNYGAEVSTDVETRQATLQWPEIEADALAASLKHQ